MAKIKFPKIKLPKVSLPKFSFPRWSLPQLPRPVSIALIAFASTIFGILLVFTVDRATNGGEVLGSVVVNGVDIGGLGERDAITRLQEFEDELRDAPVAVQVAGHDFSLDPKAIAFDLDEQAIVANAMANGRDGNVLGQFGWWLNRFSREESRVQPAFSYDEERLLEIIREWEIEGIDQPAYSGDVRIEDGQIVFEYPAVGTGIDREAAVAALAAVLPDPSRPRVTLSTRLIDPPLTQADIDAAVARATTLVGDAVDLANEEFGFAITLPRDLLTEALNIVRNDDLEVPEFEMSLRSEPIAEYVAALGPSLETDAVDAEIVIDDEAETVDIVPSIPVNEPDPDMLPGAVWAAMQSPDRSGQLPYRVGRDAEFSTEDAEGLGVKEIIGKFTTFHPCCANRVINIQKIADAVDGAIVMPGETFSLNDHVGQRTVEKGYVCAGALLGNEAVEEGIICIGGGTSQFTTTLFNAYFFAGLEDISHTPHSIWFSRYPEGREATIGWRHPELIFRNNTENAIVIRTSYTATSITAKIYGDNNDIDVEAGLSGRYNHTSVVTVNRENDELAAPYCSPETGKTVQNGTPGWTVTVYRYINYPDGTRTTESWAHRYQGAWEIVEYDPDDPSCVGPPPP